MGIVESAPGQGGNTYEDVIISRRPGSDHLMSVNADGFHSAAPARGPTLQNCEIAYTGDDLLNITPRMLVVIGRLSNRTLVVVDPEQGSVVREYARGDRVRLYRLNSHEVQAEVALSAGATRETDPALVALALAAPAKLNAEYGAHLVPSVRFTADDVWRLDFETDLPPAVQPYVSLGQCPAKGDFGGSVRNSSLHDGYARVALLKASGTQFVGNAAARSGGIHVMPEQNWLEGALDLRNVSLVDNVLEACGEPPILVDADATVMRNNTVQPGRAHSVVPGFAPTSETHQIASGFVSHVASSTHHRADVTSESLRVFDRTLSARSRAAGSTSR